MRSVIFGCLFSICLVANAIAQESKEFNLKLTGADINVIGKSLDAIPYRDAAPLIQKLQTQINEQNAAPTRSVEPKTGGEGGGCGGPGCNSEKKD